MNGEIILGNHNAFVLICTWHNIHIKRHLRPRVRDCIRSVTDHYRGHSLVISLPGSIQERIRIVSDNLSAVIGGTCIVMRSRAGTRHMPPGRRVTAAGGGRMPTWWVWAVFSELMR